VIGDDLSPFVDLTLFDMSQPVFRPHPHAGFSAVTYMLESSAGTFRNRWTAGPDELISPGTIHWNTGGIGDDARGSSDGSRSLVPWRPDVRQAAR
jgi:redox-sensitive bicupin YhaK (pirin superfamily)